MMRSHRPHQGGFTLIELLATLAIATVLLMVAIPSMLTYKRNAELTSATNTLFSAINAARGEAMKRSMYAMVVPADGANWNMGWTVFVDVNRNRIYDAGTDQLVLSQKQLPSYITVTGNGTAGATVPYVMFDASGFSAVQGSASFAALTMQLVRNDVSGGNVYDQTRRIKIALTGRARTCKPTGASDTTCTLAASGG